MTTPDEHADTAAQLLRDAELHPLGSPIREDALKRAAIHAQLATIPQPVELLPTIGIAPDDRPRQCEAVHRGNRCVRENGHGGVDSHLIRFSDGTTAYVDESDVAYPDPVMGAVIGTVSAFDPSTDNDSRGLFQTLPGSFGPSCGFMHPTEPVFCDLPLDHDGPHDHDAVSPW